MRQPTFSAAACTSNAEEDRALVQRYMQGDREAFTLLVVRYQRPVYNAAFWVLRKGEDASDISQTVFLKAAQQINDYDPRYKFFSWLYRIAINESLNLLRKRNLVLGRYLACLRATSATRTAIRTKCRLQVV